MVRRAHTGLGGRGQLNAFELLPPECSDIVVWAGDELKKRERTQTDIYSEFVTRMEALDREYRGELEFTIPSFSSFNRLSINIARMTRRMEQTSKIAESVARNFDAEKSDNLTILAADMIKTLIFELMADGGEAGIDPKGTMQLASALRAASQAQGVSTVRREKLSGDLKKGVEKVVDEVRRTKGMSAEVANMIKSKILGIDLGLDDGAAPAIDGGGAMAS